MEFSHGIPKYGHDNNTVICIAQWMTYKNVCEGDYG